MQLRGCGRFNTTGGVGTFPDQVGNEHAAFVQHIHVHLIYHQYDRCNCTTQLLGRLLIVARNAGTLTQEAHEPLALLCVLLRLL